MTGSPVFSVNFTNRTNPAKPNYHMSIKKSQAILKCFIDLKFSVWFTLGSENETMFCDSQNFFQVDQLPVKVFKTLNNRQSFASFNSCTSFELCNLPRASITRWLHAARLCCTLPFLNFYFQQFYIQAMADHNDTQGT